MSEEKCTVLEGKFLQPCWALDVIDIGPFGKAGGIRIIKTINLETREDCRSYAVIKSSANKKPGSKVKTDNIILNYCPFCGSKIDEMVIDEEEETPSV